MSNKLKIVFTRDTVCMADDMEEYILEKEFDIKDAWDELMNKIKKEHFLGAVSGNDVVWVLCDKNKREILSFFTKRDIVIKCTTDNTLEEICKDDNHLHFKYYTSPLKR